MSDKPASSLRLAAVLQALFVTFLWSTSWVLIKIGLQGIPALTFAGLRYGLAFLCLLPLVLLHRQRRAALRSLSRADWLRLTLLGVVFYAVTQGAQFLSLSYLPAATVSLLLNLTTVVVALMGVLWGMERPERRQWGGIALSCVGVAVYFASAAALGGGQSIGLIIAVTGVLANAASSVLGRSVNSQGLPPLVVTLVSMGIGAALLVGVGGAAQGFPALAARQWGIIAWLAVVNTAFAFTLWNHTLRTLSAVESSILNSTMLIQIAVLAWLFLGEPLTGQKIVGMALTGTGALIVQLRRR